MPDGWEVRNACLGGVPAALNSTNGGGDADGDNLSNLAEYQNKTNPCIPDTDGDGLTDAKEIVQYGTDPLNPDTDGDTLSDGAEVNTHGTDPKKTDTDGDGMGDAYEVAYIACLLPTVPDQGADPDGDLFGNLNEKTIGTDPCNPDTDGDGMNDGFEASNTCLKPLEWDRGVDYDSDGAQQP